MPIEINNTKNRNREAPTFANINLLGKCNVDCFFCLGKDLKEELRPFNHVKWEYTKWKKFGAFLTMCERNEISKLYITGQNTDALIYEWLDELVDLLQDRGFKVGLRTNGYEFFEETVRPQRESFEIANKCELSTGISFHSASKTTTRMILQRRLALPILDILPCLDRARVSIVLNRCNEWEFFDILRHLARAEEHIRYVQVRRPSTDTRLATLAPDIAAYERVYTNVRNTFGPPTRTLWGDADEWCIFGLPVVFWRTVKTTVNSLNYFTDGTISDEYFIVEGYLKHSA